MNTEKPSSESIDKYIVTFPDHTQKILEDLRISIRNAAPDAIEKISWGMPTFYLNGNLVHFAAYTTHIGFYPAASGIESFREELSAYKMGKGSVQFPIDRPLPFSLITRIVKFRVKENMERAALRMNKK